jgi:hypothetical protein
MPTCDSNSSGRGAPETSMGCRTNIAPFLSDSSPAIPTAQVGPPPRSPVGYNSVCIVPPQRASVHWKPSLGQTSLAAAHMSVCVCTRVGSCVSMCYMSVCVLRVHVYVCASVLLRVIPLLFMCAYAPNLNCAYICVRVHVWIKHLPEVCRRSRCSCLAASSCSSFEHTCITNIFHRSRVE